MQSLCLFHLHITTGCVGSKEMFKVVIFALAVALHGAQAKDCLQELEKVNGRELLGAFRPQCNADGTYKPMQFDESYFYCVFPKTGEEVLGTRVRFVKPKSCDLTDCVRQRHQGLSFLKMGLLGGFTPRCEDYGKFEKMQCRKGVCWCVDENGSALDGQDLTGEIPKCY